MTAEHQPLRAWRRQLLALSLAIVALYVIIPQLGSFRHGLSSISSANWSQLALAALFTVLSYLAAATTYYLLAFAALRYGRTVIVQIAGMFVNRLLPAGIGGIGTNYAYLRRSRHSGTEAACVVTVNNSLGVFGHAIFLLVTLALTATDLPGLRLRPIDKPWIVAAFVFSAVLLWVILYHSYRAAIRRSLGRFFGQLLQYRARLGHLALALGSSICLTACNVLGLWFCALSLHVNLPFVAVLIVFSFGVALGTIAPTPGGLGGVEAGLVGGFVAYHVPSNQALAITLIYRLISYWLPLGLGALAFAYSQRRGYF